MSGGKHWTEEDISYLEDFWGTKSITAIAKGLGRTPNAVKLKAYKIGLGSALASSPRISFNQLVEATGGSYTTRYEVWVEKNGLPTHTQKVKKCSFRMVDIDEFWEWADKHRSLIDFSKIEPLILGEEPEWVENQRKQDYLTNSKCTTKPWTSAEDDKLKYFISQQKYTYAEISDFLSRTPGAIQRRCLDLGIELRPIKAPSKFWTDEDHKIITQGIKNGESYTVIADKLKRSEKSLRGKVFYAYITEDLDKVRAMMGDDGQFGDNCPSPSIKQAINISKYRATCKRNIKNLANILNVRSYMLSAERSG